MNKYTIEVSVQYTSRLEIEAGTAEEAQAIAYELDVIGYDYEESEHNKQWDGNIEYPDFIRETTVLS